MREYELFGCGFPRCVLCVSVVSNPGAGLTSLAARTSAVDDHSPRTENRGGMIEARLATALVAGPRLFLLVASRLQSRRLGR
jgi:hypothetical protein